MFQELLLIGHLAVILFIYMTIVFLISLLRSNKSIVDIAWGFGFVIVALYTFFRSTLFLPRHLLVTTLVTIWGLRLTRHLFRRNWGKGEDPRYEKLTQGWGILKTYAIIFLFQGLLILIISTPVIMINLSDDYGLTLFDLVGTLGWVVGYIFESIGDYQLQAFLEKEENKGKIMKKGLWKYTRNPNYFGEVTMWWSIFLIACSIPFGWISIISPLTLTYLIIFVSGISMKDEIFKDNPEYQKYKSETSALIPGIY